jgi:hypothetical protein
MYGLASQRREVAMISWQIMGPFADAMAIVIDENRAKRIVLL